MAQSPPFNAADLLRAATIKHHVNFAVIVAEVALWAHPDVHRAHVSPENPSGAFYPHIRRRRGGEKLGIQDDGSYLDSNNYANTAMAQALGYSKQSQVGKGFNTCHIWRDTCYDPRYHTTVANLVLLPAAIVSLSDADAEVMASLQYRSFELYTWWPSELMQPKKPARYPDNWLPPQPAPT